MAKRTGLVMKSHGTGLPPWKFKTGGEDTVFETGVLCFHPENIEIGKGVYVGHYTIIKGYYKNIFSIGSGVWIGQQCFLHSAGGLIIGNDVGIGPGVKIITSSHDLSENMDLPIMRRPIQFAGVEIGWGCDIGVNAVILPGVKLGDRVQVAAGAVVTRSFPSGSVIAGVPARQINAST
jgi:acetyltransferase-like isoleucine patch superfamily enzyme